MNEEHESEWYEIYSYPPKEVRQDWEDFKCFMIEMENREEIEIEPEEGFIFEPGWINATIIAQHARDTLGTDLEELVRRHLRGDWGDLRYEEDIKANEDAVGAELRILSRYELEDGYALYIITEADRSMTTVLEVSEY